MDEPGQPAYEILRMERRF